MEQKDYYGILGVEKDAAQKAIRDAYRKLAFQYHPDRNKDPAASSRMKEINVAYAVLCDPQKRRQYDTFRQQFGSAAAAQFRQGYSDQDIFRGSDIRNVYEELSRVFGLRGFDDVFRESYGPGYRTFQFRRPGFSTRGFVFRTFPGGSAGNMRQAGLSGPFGKLLRYAIRKQWGVEIPEKGRDRTDSITIPPDLAGRGGKIHYLYRLRMKELLVTIPPGIRDGQKIRLRGMGDEGRGGGEAGDLYVSVRIRKPLLQVLRDAVQRFFPGKR